MDFEIIDFHTHPFFEDRQNICPHREYCGMSAEGTRRTMEGLGISKICGSVIRDFRSGIPTTWQALRQANDDALRLRDMYGDFYIPGFHVHPDYVAESCAEIERMAGLGVRLIGELVPYAHGWSDYSCAGFDDILDCAQEHDMVVSFHSMDDDQMDSMVKKHPDTTLIAAHPGEYREFMRHLRRMKLSRNYFLDLSGGGLYRYGMLRRGVDECGAERFLFGTDYPICGPATYVGGVAQDDLLTPAEKRLILSGNARRLLNL